MSPRTSIVIPTFNRCRELLMPCLESIVKYTNMDDVEIVIVANGCTDETEDYVKSMSVIYPQIKLLWMKDASGYAKPVNEGIKKAKGEYIILLNNDTEILKDYPKNMWIEMLMDPFIRDDKMGITGPMKVLSPSAGREFIIFFCVMISRKLVNAIGLLDESFYSYGEDTDYACRAVDAGFKIKQVPRDSNEYYADNRMKGDYPIWHIGNVSHKNFPDGDKLIARNNETLRSRYNNKPKGLDGDGSNRGNTGLVGFTSNIERALKCDGWMSESELLFLANTVYNLKSENKIICAEAGSWHGRSSVGMSSNLPPNSLLYCIDTFLGSVGEENTNHSSAKNMSGDAAFFEFCQNCWSDIESGKIIPLRMKSENAAKLLKDKDIKLDFLFIDASHDYQSVKQDIENWLPLMKEGSIICGHDYDFNNSWLEGVKRAVDEKFPNVKVAPNTSIWHHAVTKDDFRPAKSNIFDCFPMNMELDLLEMRLEELWNVVDRFVIVEADRTHGNKPKPYYFKDNLKRFEKYLSKVSHVMISDYNGFDSWSIERHQRNCIMRALTNCKESDTIIISDLDEIPNAEAVKNYNVENGIMSFEMQLFYYNENCRAKDKWIEAKILPYGLLKQLTPCGARYTQAPVIPNGGKHLSYFGGVESIKKKIEDTAHQEYNKDEFKDSSRIEKAIAEGTDLFGRDLKFEIISE